MHRARPITVRPRAARFSQDDTSCFAYYIASSSSSRLYISRPCLRVYFSFRSDEQVASTRFDTLMSRELSPTAAISKFTFIILTVYKLLFLRRQSYDVNLSNKQKSNFIYGCLIIYYRNISNNLPQMSIATAFVNLKLQKR